MEAETPSRAQAGPIESRRLERYAEACVRAGQRLVRSGGTWWREAAPCFFRPLLPFLEGLKTEPLLPRRAALGGCQYTSSVGATDANSLLVYVAFLDARDYCREQLKRQHRWELRAAGRSLVIRPVATRELFKTAAYPVYLDFQERTRYRYLEDRVRRPRFERWVEAEFSDPGLVALGAWRDGSLLAVSLSRVVGQAWLYSSFFASNEGLRRHAAALMLHEVRCLARSAGVDFVFAGMQKHGPAASSVDAFYLHRGATLVRRPAVLHVNPVAGAILRRFRPDLWNHLSGVTP